VEAVLWQNSVQILVLNATFADVNAKGASHVYLLTPKEPARKGKSETNTHHASKGDDP
jgi:hypothetical protein